MVGKLSRRGFFRLLGLGALGAVLGASRASTLLAMGAPTRVRLAYLSIPGAEPNPRPGVMEVMMLELARATSVDVAIEPVSLKADDPKLFDYPMLVLFGTREFPPLPEAQRARLELYLRSGGVLFIDDCSGLQNSPFDASVRREVARLFPQNPLERIQENHVLFRTYFLLARVGGRAAVRSYLEGIVLGDELTPIFYSRNDLPGALARDGAGGYLYECVPGGEEQRMLAYKLSINLLMYALCLNYKHDLTHVRALLKKRRGVFDE